MSHARLAPSKSERVLLCAASADREAALPDDDRSAPANEGSNAHWLLEQGVAEGVWPPAIMAFGPEKLQAALPYPDFDLPEALIQQAKDCYEYVQRRASELPLCGTLTTALVQAESKVNPELYTGRDDSYGSVDVTISSDDVLEIVDLKTGGKLVDADASQLKLYALGKMAENADPLSGLCKYKTVRLTVFQPKRPGVDTIERSVDFTQEELIEWAVDVWVPAAKASDDPNARATVTAEGCKYCKAQKHKQCPEYTAAVTGAAAQLFQPVVLETAAVAQNSAMADPMMSSFCVADMSAAQIGQFLEVWPLLKARAKDIEERGVELLTSRTAVQGHKLVRGPGRRVWGLEEEEQTKKFRNMKLKLTDIFEQKLRSPAKMLALDLATNKKELIKKHIVNKEGVLTLAPTNDKRVDAMPAVEFKPVETPATEAPVAETQAPADMDFLSL